jgi:hypothetical protein
MANNLNQYYVTFEIYKDNALAHSFDCPRSFIQSQFNVWKYAGSPYTIKVIDHTGNFRISSDILNSIFQSA